MYERILGTGKFVKIDMGGANFKHVEQFDIYDSMMREVLHTATGIDAAKAWLEQEVKRQRLACATGNCED